MTVFSALGRELAATGRQSRRAFGFLTRGERLSLLAAVVLMAGVGFLTAAIPILLGQLVDAVLKERVLSFDDAFPFLLWLGAAFFLREMLQVSRKVIVEGTCTTVESRASVVSVSTLLKLDLTYFGKQQAGAVNGRLNRSVLGTVRLLKLSFLDLFPALFGAAFAVAAALSQNLLIGMVMVGVVPVGLGIILVQLGTQRGIRLALISAREQMDGTVVEQIGGIETVRAADAADGEVTKVAIISEDLRAKAFRHHIWMAIFDAMKSLSEGLFHIAVITTAILLSLTQQLSGGEILAVSMLFVAVVTPLREVHRIVDEAHESALHAANFFSLLDEQPDRSFTTPDCEVDLDADPMIAISGLEVRYAMPDGTTRTAVDGVDIEVRAGEIVGLAGVSGSGKTTLARTLLRLAHPSQGTIRIAGTDISALSRPAIRRCFGLVSQSPFLFSGTVSQNIAFGTPGATAEQVRRAAALARIDEEIEALPEGYGYQVGERGLNLSGGQRQRIALARVFLQDPPILILDEATAALDNENERVVMDAIANVLKGRTVVMIAHRLSSLRRAKRIVVFERGKVVEQGSFDGLIAKVDGVFARIAREGELHPTTPLATSLPGNPETMAA